MTEELSKNTTNIKKKDWSFVDHIYCINLKSRDDRYTSIKSMFHSFNIPAQIYRSKKHPTNGRIGCFENHIKLIRRSYKKGHNRIMIFEDDASAENLTQEKLILIKEFLDKTIGWNIFFLGYLPDIKHHRTTPTLTPGVFGVHGLCTHAYIINREMMRAMSTMKWFGVQIDYFYSNLSDCYAVYPPLFIQGDNISDIHSSWWNKLPASVLRPLSSSFTQLTNYYALYINVPILSGKFIFSSIISTLLTSILWKDGILKALPLPLFVLYPLVWLFIMYIFLLI